MTTEAGRQLLARIQRNSSTPGYVPIQTRDAIAAIEAEAVADAAQGARLVRVASDLMDVFGTRNFRGQDISAEWGEPDRYGVYEPRFSYAGSTEAERVSEAVAAERARIVAGLEGLTKPCSCGLVQMYGMNIPWGVSHAEKCEALDYRLMQRAIAIVKGEI